MIRQFFLSNALFCSIAVFGQTNSEEFSFEDPKADSLFYSQFPQNDTVYFDTIVFKVGNRELKKIQQLTVETTNWYVDSSFKKIEQPYFEMTYFSAQIPRSDTIRDPDEPNLVLAVEDYIQDSVWFYSDTILDLTLANYFAIKKSIQQLAKDQNLDFFGPSSFDCVNYSDEVFVRTEEEVAAVFESFQAIAVSFTIRKKNSFIYLEYPVLFLKNQ